MRQPRRQRRRHEADKAVEKELHRAGVRAARGVEKYRHDKAHRADDQHADDGTDALDVIEDVVDRADHQGRDDAEQIRVLQRPGEDDEQLSDLGEIGVFPVAGLVGGDEQQQETADERTQCSEDQITLHAGYSTK